MKERENMSMLPKCGLRGKNTRKVLIDNVVVLNVILNFAQLVLMLAYTQYSLGSKAVIQMFNNHAYTTLSIMTSKRLSELWF